MSENRPYLNCSVFSEIIIKITNFFMVRSPATGTFFAKNAEWSKVFDIISTPFFAKRSLRAPASHQYKVWMICVLGKRKKSFKKSSREQKLSPKTCIFSSISNTVLSPIPSRFLHMLNPDSAELIFFWDFEKNVIFWVQEA
uniref:Uncharacterized protein n=1 Tax=Cacopsylla melanoneura TaxID=428564 RepID=A0A8D9A991_9HEMI